MLEAAATQLAVIMPTYRFDDIARQALTAAAAVGNERIRVHIGDNSENREKHSFLVDLAARSRNVVVSCHDRNIGAEANWLFLVRAQRAPFICLACDDDSFARAFFSAGATLLAADPACSAASGLLLSVADEPPHEVPIVYSPPQRLETDPLERISRYTNQNAIAYAASRREVISDFADYVEANPLKGAFNDYLLAFHLLSMGTYRLDRRGHVYVYDNDAWHLPNAAYLSSAKFYVGCGLPEEFAHLSRLHWAVANAHFFQSRYRAPALTDAVGAKIAVYLFDRMIADFRRDWKADRSAIAALVSAHRDASRALAELTRNRYRGGTWIFDAFARIVAAFSPDIAARYLAFLTETSLPHLATVTGRSSTWRRLSWSRPR